MDQKKITIFFKTERACTIYRALLWQWHARAVHDRNHACILFQPGLVDITTVSTLNISHDFLPNTPTAAHFMFTHKSPRTNH